MITVLVRLSLRLLKRAYSWKSVSTVGRPCSSLRAKAVSSAKARTSPQILRKSVQAAFMHRWCGMLAVAAQRADAPDTLPLGKADRDRPPHRRVIAYRLRNTTDPEPFSSNHLYRAAPEQHGPRARTAQVLEISAAGDFQTF